jgi:hypothetical protein
MIRPQEDSNREQHDSNSIETPSQVVRGKQLAGYNKMQTQPTLTIQTPLQTTGNGNKWKTTE